MELKEQHRLNCPARCKDKNTCHERAYFLQKAGSVIKAKACIGNCKYMKNWSKANG